jgi:hypothetical protein
MPAAASRPAQRHAAGHRATALLVAALFIAGLALGFGAVGVRADAGAAPIHIYGTGAIGTGAATQTVTLDAATGSDFNTLSITIGDPSTSPTPISGTVGCVGLWSTHGVNVGATLSDGRPVLISIANGAPDTMTVAIDANFGADCTTGLDATTPLSSGDFTIEPLACPAGLAPTSNTADLNADFIVDGLQPGSTAYRSFCDGVSTKPTYGYLSDTGGLTLLVSDAPAPDGVQVAVDPGPAGSQATFWVCGGYTVTVAQGSTATITCASVKLAVETGSASVVLSGGSTIVTVGTGGATEVGRDPDGTYTIDNTGTNSIAITTDGVTTTLTPQDPPMTLRWSFIGFTSPVDMGGVLNQVKAGMAIPLRWRLLDGDGAPVTGLTSAAITATSLSCDLGTTTDLINETSPGATGLRSLGDGYYELVWKSPAAYAGSCKTLHLDIGDGTTHDALFEFTR